MWRRFHPRQEQKQKGSMNLLNMPQLILDSCALCCHCPSPGCPIWRGFHQPRLQQKQRVAWTCWTFPSWSWTAVLSLPESRVGREGHKRRREGGLLEASSKKRVGGLLGVLAKRGEGREVGSKKRWGSHHFLPLPPFLEEAPPCPPLKKSGTPQSGRSASIMNLCPKNCCTAVFKSATLPLSGSNKATASAWQRHLKFRAAISHFLHGACCRFAFQLHGSGTFSSCGN